MGGSGEVFLFVVYKELEVFLSSVECALSSVEPFGFFEMAFLAQEIEEAVAKSNGCEKKNGKEDIHPFRDCEPPLPLIIVWTR